MAWSLLKAASSGQLFHYKCYKAFCKSTESQWDGQSFSVYASNCQARYIKEKGKSRMERTWCERWSDEAQEGSAYTICKSSTLAWPTCMDQHNHQIFSLVPLVANGHQFGNCFILIVGFQHTYKLHTFGLCIGSQDSPVISPISALCEFTRLAILVFINAEIHLDWFMYRCSTYP